MSLPSIRLKKGEDRRIRAGHPWIFSNEIDTAHTTLKSYAPGTEVIVEAHDKTNLGIAYLNPHSLIVGRIFSREMQTRLTLDFFQKQIRTALSLREYLFDKPFYRLVFSEADNLPGIIIDRFANDFVLQINTAGMEQKISVIVEALCTLFPTLHSIFLRNDSAIREQEGLECYAEPAYGETPEEIDLVENQVLFHIPVWKGQKTGWFYDHRMNRARLQAYVKNKTVLDVFSYVGGWGIQAAVFGARKITCIEASKFACGYIAKNAALNHVENKLTITCDDAFDAMKKSLQQKQSYEVIVLDPPAFVKRFKDRQAGLIAYQRLNELALKLLENKGILITCSCSMHVSEEDMLKLLQRASFNTQTKIQLIERGHQGPDHPIHIAVPETNYLKAMVVRKTD